MPRPIVIVTKNNRPVEMIDCANAEDASYVFEGKIRDRFGRDFLIRDYHISEGYAWWNFEVISIFWYETIEEIAQRNREQEIAERRHANC